MGSFISGHREMMGKPLPFPSEPSKFSCQFQAAGSISLVGDFASASALMKSATPSELQAPSTDSIKTDFSAHQKMADTASVQYLLLFLQQAGELFTR